MALELMGQKLVGPAARTTFVGDAWTRVLPRIAPLVAAEPDRLIAAVCNATYQLATTTGARPAFWIDTMERLASQCADGRSFLTLGHIVAWRAGMAHLRESALVATDSLSDSLVLEAISGGSHPERWTEIRDRLLADPWFDPANPATTARVVARAGAFRGFGGLFTEPPVVVMVGEQLFARDGNSYWLVKADAFGATFHRATPDEFGRTATQRFFPAGVSLRGTTLTVHGARIEVPGVVDEPTSVAVSRTTLALTSPFTHAIVLVALPSVG
jgi:hypothetical protein